MRNFNKIFTLGLSLMMCLGLFIGCSEVTKYNAVLYDTAIDWMTTDYIDGNVTRNSMIPESKSAPKTITHIIASQNDFDYAFTEFPLEVDFDNEILVVYFFTGDIIINTLTGDRIFSYRIKDLNVASEEISITLAKKALVSGPTGSPPTQECLVVKVAKVNVAIAKVKLIYE